MTDKELLSLRLAHQKLSSPETGSAAGLVSWMGAVQAQDYAMSKWALGLRIKESTDQTIERAINDGAILRTHILRPTWHLIAAEDIRWMIKLTATHVKKLMAYYDRQLAITSKELSRSRRLFEKTLRDNVHLSRPELQEFFIKAKFHVDGIRFAHLLMHAELDGILCNGVRKGKQNTYALLEERVPAVKEISREASLEKLARKYFQSHGPASVNDFTWWSGLPVTDARLAVALLGKEITSADIKGETVYFFEPETLPKMSREIWLLPNYDEYTVAYSNRCAMLTNEASTKILRGGNPLFSNTVIMGGRVMGTWKRTIKKHALDLVTDMFTTLSPVEKKAMAKAEQRYKDFLGLAENEKKK